MQPKPDPTPTTYLSPRHILNLTLPSSHISLKQRPCPDLADTAVSLLVYRKNATHEPGEVKELGRVRFK